MAKDFDKQKNNLLEEKVINIGRVTKVEDTLDFLQL